MPQGVLHTKSLYTPSNSPKTVLLYRRGDQSSAGFSFAQSLHIYPELPSLFLHSFGDITQSPDCECYLHDFACKPHPPTQSTFLVLTCVVNSIQLFTQHFHSMPDRNLKLIMGKREPFPNLQPSSIAHSLNYNNAQTQDFWQCLPSPPSIPNHQEVLSILSP